MIRLTSESILARIGQEMPAIREFGVRKIGLFGSYARNEQGDGSDIDILVEFEKGGKTFDNYMDLKFFLENIFGCRVDLVISEAVKPDLRSVILGGVQYAAGA